MKSLEFFDQIARYSHASESDQSSTSPKDEFEQSDESQLLVFDEKSDNKIRCEVCGKTFNTRSQKWYHRKKDALGTGCNIKISLGRPKKSPKSIVERRTEKIESKQEKLIENEKLLTDFFL